MKKTTVAVVLAVLLSASESAARDLVELIPGLYGGDGVTLAPAAPPAPDHSTHFSIAASSSINRLNKQIAAEIGAFPFSSSVGGFTFAFDQALGNFVSTTETLGPLFAERAPTLGRGKLNLQFSATFFSYDDFNGKSLNDLQVIALHDPDEDGVREGFRRDVVLMNVDLDIDVRIFTMAATYGITDRLDVGLLVPIASIDMDVQSRAEVVESPENEFPGTHTFVGAPESPNDATSGDATGLGDIVLRAKYHLLKSEVVDIAGSVLTKLETGDEKDFLGTGATTIRPFFVFSRTLADVVTSDIFLTPHLNIGYEFNLDQSNRSSVEYVAGFDVGTERFTIVGDILGSHEPKGDDIGDDILTASVGFKWNIVKRLLLFANVQLPLNEEGLRSDLIPTLGMEYNF